MDGENSHLFVICSQVCLKWRPFTDLLRTETFLVPQIVLKRRRIVAEWTRVGATKSVRSQMLPHLTQHPALPTTWHAYESIFNLEDMSGFNELPWKSDHDNAAIDELIWKPRRSMNTCKYEDIEPNRKTRSSSTLTNRFHFNLDPAYSCLFNQHCIKHW